MSETTDGCAILPRFEWRAPRIRNSPCRVGGAANELHQNRARPMLVWGEVIDSIQEQWVLNRHMALSTGESDKPRSWSCLPLVLFALDDEMRLSSVRSANDHVRGYQVDGRQ